MTDELPSSGSQSIEPPETLNRTAFMKTKEALLLTPYRLPVKTSSADPYPALRFIFK
jgi:hypothetical protein